MKQRTLRLTHGALALTLSLALLYTHVLAAENEVEFDIGEGNYVVTVDESGNTLVNGQVVYEDIVFTGSNENSDLPEPPEPPVDTGDDTAADTGTGEDSQTDPDAGQDSGSDSQTDADPGQDSGSDSQTDADAGQDSGSDSQTDSDPGHDPGDHSHSDSDPDHHNGDDSQTDPNKDPDSEDLWVPDNPPEDPEVEPPMAPEDTGEISKNDNTSGENPEQNASDPENTSQNDQNTDHASDSQNSGDSDFQNADSASDSEISQSNDSSSAQPGPMLLKTSSSDDQSQTDSKTNQLREAQAQPTANITIRGAAGKVINIILRNLTIQAAGNAIDIGPETYASIKAEGTNKIASQGSCAAIHITDENSFLTILGEDPKSQAGGQGLIVQAEKGAAIGSNAYEDMSADVSVIDAKLAASSESGAAVGSGEGGTVTYYSQIHVGGETNMMAESTDGAAIGTGAAGDNNGGAYNNGPTYGPISEMQGHVTVDGNADLTVINYERGAGIGSGYASKVSGGSQVDIGGNAVVNMTCHRGAMIGTGAGYEPDPSYRDGCSFPIPTMGGMVDIFGSARLLLHPQETGTAFIGATGGGNFTSDITVKDKAFISSDGNLHLGTDFDVSLPDLYLSKISIGSETTLKGQSVKLGIVRKRYADENQLVRLNRSPVLNAIIIEKGAVIGDTVIRSHETADPFVNCYLDEKNMNVNCGHLNVHITGEDPTPDPGQTSAPGQAANLGLNTALGQAPAPAADAESLFEIISQDALLPYRQAVTGEVLTLTLEAPAGPAAAPEGAEGSKASDTITIKFTAASLLRLLRQGVKTITVVAPGGRQVTLDIPALLEGRPEDTVFLLILSENQTTLTAGSENISSLLQ